MKLPTELRHYFWDIDTTRLNVRKYPVYVMVRLLEFGDEGALRWLRQTFGDDAIAQVVRTSRQLSRRTANFWRLMLALPRNEIACLSKRSQRQPENCWND